MIDSLPCPVCHSQHIGALLNYTKHHLSKCFDCGMVFANIIPDQQELDDHYAHYGRTDYFSPITQKRYLEWLAEFEKFRSTGKILDVGCGVGYFLETAKTLGWEVHGTEYTDRAIEICRNKGIQMHQGDLLDIDLSHDQFDVVVSIEVLEHLQAPLPHLKKIHKLLRPGGALYLTTPNFSSLNSKILKERWNVVSYPEHLSYFSKKSLHRALEKNHFKKVHLKTYGISYETIKTSLQKTTIDPSNAQTDDEKMRKATENFKMLKMIKHAINGLLNVFSLGESLKAFYIKS